jgi:hypothetical protein
MVPAVARGSSWGRLEMVKKIADVYRRVLPS